MESVLGHAPHGACELKSTPELTIEYAMGHAPHGACELKLIVVAETVRKCGVTLPTERVS